MRSRIAFIAVAVLVAAGAVGDAGAQTGVSARVLALGNGHLEGIIRDDLTDLARNPAWLAGMENAAVLYRFRERVTEDLYIPYLRGSFLEYRGIELVTAMESTGDYVMEYDTHELAVYGCPLGAWRLAFSLDWSIDTRDDQTSAAEADARELDRYESGASFSRRINDREFWHVALSAARRVGTRAFLGIRLGGGGVYQREEWTNRGAEQQFQAWQETTYRLTREIYSESVRDNRIRRRRTIYGKAGLVVEHAAGDLSSIVLEVARSAVAARTGFSGSSIDWRYNYDPDSYSYDYEYAESMDSRETDRWTARLDLRRERPSGITTLLGGGVEWGPIDGAWRNYGKEYGYRNYVNERRCLDASFDSSGDGLRGFGLARVGASTSPREDIVLYGGLSCTASHFTWEESPVLSSAVLHSSNDEYERWTKLQSLRFERRITRVAGALPVACELTPRPWFAFRAGFVVGAAWERARSLTTVPVLDTDAEYISPPAPIPPMEAIDENVRMIRYATAGFSFRWNDRLVADLYTESDLTPDAMNYMAVDLRYVF